ncbi:CaiB/BaiF CoA transferase family protein [Vibrio nigripulchritudo]|uniref:CaiB/BaiF CoA transferase family protein n=1 Tax=Vibrio nigripulchritudo TaxID=28173 RepID=UPI0003B1BDDD|nr:CaiB/BaiF CoA-transferase family protein [Vibrio nigripulchritudo]CCN71073.1 putative CoA-transferase family III [Vibrio nigripulchritudo SFn118]
MTRPLEGKVIVDFSQFLAGPLAGLKLSDLGARVIKIERPGSGDLCRHLYLTDTDVGGVNSLFQAINRNKESFCADLKNPDDVAVVKELLKKADIVLQNFRPGVIERLGLDYETIRQFNPTVIYGSVSGYGTTGPWVNRPGQDLLAQSLSGVTWLSGNKDMPPTPMGLAIADMLAGNALVQGVLAALVRSNETGEGGKVETSLLEVLVDFQFEVLTTYLNDGKRDPDRAKVNNAHAYLSAPYGIYETKDSYIAIAMGSVDRLGKLMEDELIASFTDSSLWFSKRDEIKALIQLKLLEQNTEHWMSIFAKHDVWASEVLNWDELLESDAFKHLDMLQKLDHEEVEELMTTRLPIRFDGHVMNSSVAAPSLGQHTESIIKEFLLK